MIHLHYIGASALGLRPQISCVSEHLRERYQRSDGVHAVLRVHSAQLAAAERASLPPQMPDQLSLFDNPPVGEGLSV